MRLAVRATCLCCRKAGPGPLVHPCLGMPRGTVVGIGIALQVMTAVKVGLPWCDIGTRVGCCSRLSLKMPLCTSLMMIKGGACFFLSTGASTFEHSREQASWRGERGVGKHQVGSCRACLEDTALGLYSASQPSLPHRCISTLPLSWSSRSEKCRAQSKRQVPLIPGRSQYEETRCGHPNSSHHPQSGQGQPRRGAISTWARWVPLFSTI
jgi:hypothetical protein